MYICSMQVTSELIDHLAKLARLQLQPEAKEVLRNDMEKMIGFIEKLQELNTEGVTPLLHMTGEINALRQDVPDQPLTTNTALNAAKIKDDQFFMVPKMIKK